MLWSNGGFVSCQNHLCSFANLLHEVAGVVTRMRVTTTIGFIVLFTACVMLSGSLLSLLGHTDSLPGSMWMIGQDVALAMLGLAVMLCGRQRFTVFTRLMYLLAFSLAAVALIPWLALDGWWQGRVSQFAVVIVLLIAISALLFYRSEFSVFVMGTLGIGLATALALFGFISHLSALTLFSAATPEGSMSSLMTFLLLTLLALAHGYGVLKNPVFRGWQIRHPGQSVFVDVMILLSFLFVIALGCIGAVVVREYLFIAYTLLLSFFLLGLLVIYRPIVALVNNKAAIEQVLRARESALEQAQSQARLGSWRITLPDGELEWSAESYRIFGMSPVQPITFEKFIAAVYPEDREYVRKCWQQAMAGANYDIEHRIVCNGDVKWVRERADLEFDENSKLIGGVGTVQDITQLKTKEAQLRDSRDQLRMLAAHNEDIREHERASIARELHDEMGQQLTVLRLDAALIEKRARQLDPALTDMLSGMKAGVDEAISAMRDVASCLRPLALDAGLMSAVDWLLESYRQRTGLCCDLILDGSDAQLDAGRTTTAFRVLQESLTNVVRHADASRLSVRISITPSELLLSVSDNGTGFNPATVSSTRRFGLMGIRERVLVYGGTTTIDSEPGRGTTLSVIIPLDRTAEIQEKN